MRYSVNVGQWRHVFQFPRPGYWYVVLVDYDIPLPVARQAAIKVYSLWLNQLKDDYDDY